MEPGRSVDVDAEVHGHVGGGRARMRVELPNRVRTKDHLGERDAIVAFVVHEPVEYVEINRKRLLGVTQLIKVALREAQTHIEGLLRLVPHQAELDVGEAGSHQPPYNLRTSRNRPLNSSHMSISYAVFCLK